MLKVLSLFSGIGAFEKALENLGIKFELVGFSEIDKYASASYCAIHEVSADKNLGDITKIDESNLPKDIDLITYGFPCQDISLAGKQKGLFNEDGTQTRSGLFFEALRIIEGTKPKFAIAENVKNLTGKKFKEQFKTVLQSLENAGYVNYWQVLNAKDFGIPQNRERVFIISIRKDIDTGYEFPEKQELKLRLKDLLEEKVDEKYYITNFDSISPVNSEYSMINGGPIGKMHDVSRRVYETSGVAPTVHCCGGGNTEPKVAVAMRGRYNEDGQVEQHVEVSDREYANTITTVQKDCLVGEPIIVDDTYANREPRWYGKTSPSIRAERSGFKVVEPTLQTVIVPQTVKVRKHEVDIEKLKAVLREHKNYSNKELALILDKPLTLVEHWFRNDNYFSIPDADIWLKLKALLKIETDEFDLSIMEFEERDGVFEKTNRCYCDTGIAPTLTGTSADEKIIESSDEPLQTVQSFYED